MEWYYKDSKKYFEDAFNNNHSWEWKIEDPKDGASCYGVKVLGQKGSSSISVIFQSYSACCAFYEMNYFRYASIESEKELHGLLDYILTCLRELISGTYARKLVLNTVQHNREDYTSDQTDLLGKPMKGDIYYPFVHSWATSQKAGFVDSPIVNHNTGRIIHHLITFPDVCNSVYDDEDEDNE